MRLPLPSHTMHFEFRVPEGRYLVTTEFLDPEGMVLLTLESSYHARSVALPVTMSDPIVSSAGMPILDEIPAGSKSLQSETIVYGMADHDLTVRTVLYFKGQELGRLNSVQYSAVAERISILRKGNEIRPFSCGLSTEGLPFGEYYLEIFVSDEERVLYETGKPLYIHWDQLPQVITNWEQSLGLALNILPASWTTNLSGADSTQFLNFWCALDIMDGQRPYTAMESFYFRITQMQQLLSVYALPDDPLLLRLSCWYGIPASIIPSTVSAVPVLSISFPDAGRTCLCVQKNGKWHLKEVQYAS